MNEAAGSAPGPATAPSAGRLLREARERQGLHIAALAASIKVAQKKLELLEADRFDALPDVTFTRALAQTVCRALKIDPAAVLALLPPPARHRLAQVGEGLNAPFRERPGALVQRDGSSLTLSPVFWVTALILIAAIGIYFIPAGVIGMPHWRANAASAAAPRDAASGVAAAPADALFPADATPAPAAETTPTTVTTIVAIAAPSPAPLASGAATIPVGATPSPGGDAAGGTIQFRTEAASWVEVTDARGRTLVSRLVAAGEVFDVDGAAPYRVRIGNASGTRLSFRGQPTELAAYTRDNVARLELK